MLTLVVGTRNAKKKAEIEKILAGLPLRLKSVADYPDAPDVVEDGDTFEENARKKALEYATALGEWVVADDSGLQVDALGGEPGVHSARYAGPDATGADLCRKLLGELADVPPESRTARFRCVIAVAKPGEVLFAVQAAVEGMITREMRGSGGFGYDPVFLYPRLGRTFAELTMEEKNSVSHRGRALELFKVELKNRLG